MICVVLDTNLLKSGSTDFTVVHFVNKLNDIIGEIESNDLYDKVQILIPQIVLDELFEHQKKAYSDKLASIRSCKFHDFDVIPHPNYEQWLHDKYIVVINELAVRDAKCLVIPYPDNDILHNIIRRAVAKKAPFEGKEKESDKGFKDVILWESVLKYKRSHITDTIILCSKDARICDNSLEVEYKNLFDDKVFLLKLNTDSYSPIYELLSELTNSPVKQTFAERLKTEVVSLLNENFISDLYSDYVVMHNDKAYVSKGACLCDLLIKNIEDAPDENGRLPISISVVLMIKFNADDSESFILVNHRIDIEYSFEEKVFYLTEYEFSNGEVRNVKKQNYIIRNE